MRLMALTPDLRTVLRERQPVEARGAEVAERQAELPAPGHLEVVGDLLAADLVVNQPGAIRAGRRILDLHGSLRFCRALGVPADVLSSWDHLLAAGIPSVPDGAIVVAVVVVVEGLRDANEGSGGPGIWGNGRGGRGCLVVRRDRGPVSCR